jgi:hypothetical protein
MCEVVDAALQFIEGEALGHCPINALIGTTRAGLARVRP